jgi:hypothetical protein
MENDSTVARLVSCLLRFRSVVMDYAFFRFGRNLAISPFGWVDFRLIVCKGGCHDIIDRKQEDTE